MTCAIYSIPGFITNRMLKCIEEAEKILKTPPTIYDCYMVIQKNHPWIKINNVYEITAIMTSMMREDWIYTDDAGYHVSLKRHEGYTNFSEKCRFHFKDRYIFLKDGTLATS